MAQHTATRRKLPVERVGKVHEFIIAGQHEGLIRMGEYPDGTLGEFFIKMSKSGSTMSGIMDGFATVCSIALQYGVPIDVLADKFIGSRFEPSGITQNEDIKTTTSVLDYVFRYLKGRYGKEGVDVTSKPAG